MEVLQLILTCLKNWKIEETNGGSAICFPLKRGQWDYSTRFSQWIGNQQIKDLVRIE
jgi:hypothetical protein